MRADHRMLKIRSREYIMIQHYVVEALVWAYVHIDVATPTLLVIAVTAVACLMDRGGKISKTRRSR